MSGLVPIQSRWEWLNFVTASSAKPSAKILATTIAWKAMYGHCSPSISSLASLSGLNQRTVCIGLAELVERRFILKTSGKGQHQPNTYTLNMESVSLASSEGPALNEMQPSTEQKEIQHCMKYTPALNEMGDHKYLNKKDNNQSRGEQTLGDEDLDKPQETQTTPEQQWNYERLQPWARTLVPILCGKIHKANWQTFKGCVDTCGIEFVANVAKSIQGRWQWASEFADLCFSEYNDPPAQPDPNLIRGIAYIKREGWQRIIERTGLENAHCEQDVIDAFEYGVILKEVLEWSA